MCLKEYGWETYRLRSHSSPTSYKNTDTPDSNDRRLSKAGTICYSPNKNTSLYPTHSSIGTSCITNESTMRNDPHAPLSVDVSSAYQYHSNNDQLSGDLKSKRAATMPSSILVNTTEKTDIRKGNKKCMIIVIRNDQFFLFDYFS